MLIKTGDRTPVGCSDSVAAHHHKSAQKDLRTPRVTGWLAAVVLIGCLSLTFTGCGGEDGGAQGPELTADEFVEIGWEAFERYDYASALEHFQAAIGRDATHSDALNGAGWSSGRLPGMMETAADYFARSLASDTTEYDALGGWAFVEYSLEEWHSALNKADSLMHRRPRWMFLHEPTVDFHDIRLLAAKVHYNLGDFTASLDVIVTYLNPSFEADITTEAGRRELLEEIARLGQLYG